MKKKNLFALVIIVLIIASLFILNNNKETKISENAKVLYDYFNIDYLDNCSGLFNYDSKKIEEGSVDEKVKLCAAYNKEEKKDYEIINLKKDKKANICTKDDMKFRVDDEKSECNVSKVPSNIVLDSYKKMYGTEPSQEIKSFQVDNLHICYLKDNYYYCGLSETFTYTFGSDLNIYRTIDKTIEKGSELEIYDYFIKVIDEKCYTTYVNDTENTKCTNSLKNNKKIKYKFLKKNGTLYKHVFIKDDENIYHWVSSEPVLK